MKIISILLFIILMISGCNVEPDNAYNISKSDITIQNTDQMNEETLKLAEGEAFSLLGDYDGDWYINGLLVYFFYNDPINLDYIGTTLSSDDKLIGSKLHIDISNNTVTFDGDDTYKIMHVSELSSDELARTLFAPDWGNVGEDLAREICGGIYYEEDGVFGRRSEGDHVKYIRFENTPDDSEYSDFISFIISANGELLINIGESAGTYTLLRIM